MTNITKFVCISDTHAKHRQLDMPEGDILLHSGDITMAHKSNLIQEEEQVRDFALWLGELPYKEIVIVAGNHDFLFEKRKFLAIDLLTEHAKNVHYLDQTSVLLEGFNIYGEPRQPRFYDWAFNVSRTKMKDVWELVPEDIDILVTHGPPNGYGDLVLSDHSMDVFAQDKNPYKHAGCKHFKNMIEQRKDTNPFKLTVSGHIHEGYGQWYRPAGKTHVVNASVVNKHYRVVNKPIVIELDNP